jgi:outer membrane translocation and assembly module TamA
VVPGSRFIKAQQIGEVGTRMILQFEVRPVDPKTMEQGAGWTKRYGADLSMEWSRYQAVFYSNVFGKTNGDKK